jgi:hypothetical protein
MHAHLIHRHQEKDDGVRCYPDREIEQKTLALGWVSSGQSGLPSSSS